VSHARRAVVLILVMALALVVADARRPPASQWTAAGALGLISTYQRWLSPRVSAAGVRCRFEPTCSWYAAAVIRRDGIARGTWLTLRRLVRCGPWTPMGTLDPP
jgi:uncharacterized protein